jgi:hypothetical protein
MTPIVSNSKTMDVNNILIQESKKIQNKYRSFIKYTSLSQQCYFQTPVIQINNFDNSVMSFQTTPELEKVLGDIDSYCKEFITQNSTYLFKGKNFSNDRIESSFVNTVQNSTFSTFISDSLEIRDQNFTKLSLQDIYSFQNAVALIHIKGIVYKKSSIQLLISLEQLKVYERDNLDKWCIETVYEADKTPVKEQVSDYSSDESSEYTEDSDSGIDESAPVEPVESVESAPAPPVESVPVESAPAPPVESVPVEYVPAPVEYVPTPVEYVPAPVESAPESVEYVPVPVDYVPVPVDYVPESAATPVPVEYAPESADAPVPVESSTEPVKIISPLPIEVFKDLELLQVKEDRSNEYIHPLSMPKLGYETPPREEPNRGVIEILLDEPEKPKRAYKKKSPRHKIYSLDVVDKDLF